MALEQGARRRANCAWLLLAVVLAVSVGCASATATSSRDSADTATGTASVELQVEPSISPVTETTYATLSNTSEVPLLYGRDFLIQRCESNDCAEPTRVGMAEGPAIRLVLRPGESTDRMVVSVSRSDRPENAPPLDEGHYRLTYRLEVEGSSEVLVVSEEFEKTA